MTQTISYHVPGISCDHCAAAIRSEVGAVAGVESVDVDVAGRTVTVLADSLDEAAVVAAIGEAGYGVAAGWR